MDFQADFYSGDIDNSCRTCLKTGSPLRSIHEVAIDQFSFANILSSLCHDFSEADERLSGMICYRCQESAIVSYGFQKMIQENQEKVKIAVEMMKQEEVEVEEVLSDFEDNVASFQDLIENSPENLVKDEDEEDDLEVNTMKSLPENAIELFLCQTCFKEFQSLEILKEHEQKHKKTGQKRIQKVENFEDFLPKRQKYERDEEGRFICQFCNGRYKSRDILTRHIKKHVSEKEFKCELCPREFYFLRDLNAHLKSHQERENKTFDCDLCELKEFKSKYTLKMHREEHFGIQSRKFSCEICQQVFKSKANLQKHEMIHRNEKPFSCTFCKASFIQKITLKRHMKSIHHEMIYDCDFCFKNFETKGELREHWKMCEDLKSSRNSCNQEEVVIESVSNEMYYEDSHEDSGDQSENVARSFEVDFDED